MRQSLLLMLLVAVIPFTSCVNQSSLQTGRTLNEGDAGFVGGGGFMTGRFAPETDDDEFEGRISLPYLEGAGFYGVNDRFMIGGKLTVIGSVQILGKYQIAGDSQSKFAASIGGVAGLTPLFIVNFIDLKVPLYLSYHPTESFAFYATPAYQYRGVIVTDDDISDIPGMNQLGASAGIKIGTDMAVMFEYSYFAGEYDVSTSQFTVGLAIDMP